MKDLSCSNSKFLNQSIILMRYNLLIIFIILFISTNLSAQTGSISGKVTDASNNEVLIGANVLVVGTTTGASSDLDGYYSINGLAPGIYQIKISYISYQTKGVDNVVVKENQETKINVPLNPASTELDEVVVTAEALRNSEVSVLKIQQKSEGIVDGVSAELISKNNSSDGTDVLKRMTGVTITEGKYLYIRGVGDRYNNTLLNGANLPSTDPEKKSFSYDIFPASLIENLITAKTFTPDKPADFSGGLVQISTIEFPSKFIIDVSTTSSYTTETTGKSFLSYKGGSRDFLGYDNGTRSLPETINGQKIVRGNFTSDQLKDIGLSFKNNWNTIDKTAPINSGLKLTLGDKIDFDEGILGYIASFTYSNSYETKEIENNSYALDGYRYEYAGAKGTYSVMWGGLFNLSYKFSGNNKISFKNVYNQNADDETIFQEGRYRGSDQHRSITSLRYVSRNLLSNQLMGEHHFGLMNGLTAEWNLSYANSKREEPDARRFIYGRGIENPDQPFRFLLDQSLTTRYFGNLDDDNYGASADFTLKPFVDPNLPTFKIGYNFDKKERIFDARTFGFRNVPGGSFMKEDSVLQSSVDKIFTPENFNSQFIEIIEMTKASDSYDSEEEINSTYLMLDATLLSKFRVVTGVRNEYSTQMLNSKTQTGEDVNVNESYNDILPALNVTYLLNENINIRAAYSITLARPEFRELAPFSYFDFVANELVEGNPALKRSLIYNYDLRFEVFPNSGELYALSFFYKKFKDPIEQILISASAFEPTRSYLNGETANNYGIELELRKSLNFISPVFDYLSFVGNVSLIQSEIEVTKNSSGNSFQVAKRSLQGQANYILNAGLYYDNYDLGFNSSIVYNKVGHKIDKVGYSGVGDVIELPRDLLDFSVSQKVLSHFTIKFLVKDLFNQDRKLIQRTPDGDKTADLEKTGRSFSLGFSYQL